MTRRFYISILLVLVVILAGCVSGGRTKTEIISKDMIVIKSIDVFPSRNVQPEDSIIIRMEAENLGQDTAYLLVDSDNDMATGTGPFDGDYMLMDHCKSLYHTDEYDPEDPASAASKFQMLSGAACETDLTKVSFVKDSAGNEINKGCYLRFASLQTHTFQWTLKAPPSGKIANMAHKCIFKFQTAYAAKAVTNTYVYFADPLELAQRLYTKKEMSMAGDNIASFGPVAINFVPAEPQPIPAKTGGKWTVFLNLMNVGAGLADVTTLSILLPDGINIYTVGSEDKCLMGGVLDAAKLREQQKVLEILNRVVPYPPQFQVRAKLQQYLNTPEACKGKSTGDCSAGNQALIQKYDAICFPLGNDPFCNAPLPDVTANINDVANRLQIVSGKSSRIPCELTTPNNVPILTPFRFITAADYNYKIRQDIDITTTPVRESA